MLSSLRSKIQACCRGRDADGFLANGDARGRSRTSQRRRRRGAGTDGRAFNMDYSEEFGVDDLDRLSPIEERGVDGARARLRLQDLPASVVADLCPETTSFVNANQLRGESSVCCTICFESILAGKQDGEAIRIVRGCGHVFHAACVDPWIRNRFRCPNCMASIHLTNSMAFGSSNTQELPYCMEVSSTAN